MKFEQALYMKGKESRIIQLRSIILEKNFEEVIENLYCPYEGCNARLVYNRRGNGNNYLSKHIGDLHVEGCEYDSEMIPVKSTKVFLDENGRLSDKGISRRKLEAMNAFDDFIDPPKEKTRKPTKPSPRKKKQRENKLRDEFIEERAVKRIKYDPDAPAIDVNRQDNSNIREPAFLQRNLNQISIKDVGKNLRTSAKLEKIVINESENRAQIYGSLREQRVIFELPPSFFTSEERRTSSVQLVEFLKILNGYITSKNVDLFITTLCQSHDINVEKLALFIYEPEFMSFQFIRGKRFKTLSEVVIAITTKSI